MHRLTAYTQTDLLMFLNGQKNITVSMDMKEDEWDRHREWDEHWRIAKWIIQLFSK